MHTDDIEKEIISILKEGSGSSHNCSLHLPNAVTLILKKINPSASDEFNNNISVQERHAIKNKLSEMTANIIWDMCRMGVLRVGSNTTSPYQPGWDSDHYSLTEYGQRWLKEKDSNLIPAYPGRFTQSFDKFQPSFGANYFERAQEAVRCYQSCAWLACVVMCGAAAESILLRLAVEKIGEEEVNKLYFRRDGRKNVETELFKGMSPYISQRYKEFTGLMKDWRDSAAHGHKANITSEDAYISLLTLLHFARFMEQHLSSITKP